MRTTLVLDDDVLSAARSLSRARKVSLGKAVSELARRGLEPGGPAHTIDSDGIPILNHAPDQGIITTEMIVEFLNNDDNLLA